MLQYAMQCIIIIMSAMMIFALPVQKMKLAWIGACQCSCYRKPHEVYDDIDSVRSNLHYHLVPTLILFHRHPVLIYSLYAVYISTAAITPVCTTDTVTRV